MSTDTHTSSVGSNEMSRTSTPAHWSDAANLEFLEFLATFCSQKAGLTPPTSTYVQWSTLLSTNHAFPFTVKQLRTRYQCFKKVYNLFMGMKNDSGLGWDEEQQTVRCDEWKWKDYCKRDKELKHLRNSLSHYDLYYAIFAGSLTTGNNAAPSNDPYLQRRNAADEVASTGKEDGDEPTMETGSHSGDKRPSSSRGRKGKQKRANRVSEHESNMSALASVLVSRFDTDVSSAHSRQSGPRGEEMEQVVRIVGNLPDLSEQQIIGVFEFFRINPDAVPIFLTMQERYRSGYIRLVVS